MLDNFRKVDATRESEEGDFRFTAANLMRIVFFWVVLQRRSQCQFVSQSEKYRVSIKYFPDYKHLLQENYCTWNTNIFFATT